MAKFRVINMDFGERIRLIRIRESKVYVLMDIPDITIFWNDRQVCWIENNIVYPYTAGARIYFNSYARTKNGRHALRYFCKHFKHDRVTEDMKTIILSWLEEA